MILVYIQCRLYDTLPTDSPAVVRICSDLLTTGCGYVTVARCTFTFPYLRLLHLRFTPVLLWFAALPYRDCSLLVTAFIWVCCPFYVLLPHAPDALRFPTHGSPTLTRHARSAPGYRHTPRRLHTRYCVGVWLLHTAFITTRCTLHTLPTYAFYSLPQFTRLPSVCLRFVAFAFCCSRLPYGYLHSTLPSRALYCSAVALRGYCHRLLRLHTHYLRSHLPVTLHIYSTFPIPHVTPHVYIYLTFTTCRMPLPCRTLCPHCSPSSHLRGLGLRLILACCAGLPCRRFTAIPVAGCQHAGYTPARWLRVPPRFHYATPFVLDTRCRFAHTPIYCCVTTPRVPRLPSHTFIRYHTLPFFTHT